MMQQLDQMNQKQFDRKPINVGFLPWSHKLILFKLIYTCFNSMFSLIQDFILMAGALLVSLAKVSSSFIDTACTMGNRVSCLQPAPHYLPTPSPFPPGSLRFCVTHCWQIFSCVLMKLTKRLLATGPSTKSWCRKEEPWRESAGCSWPCPLVECLQRF